MNRIARLNIPLRPVSVNSYYRHSSRGVYISKRGKQFREDIKEYISHLKPISEQVVLTIDFMFKGKRNCDVDNYLKGFLDSLIGYLYIDDGQVKKIIVEKFANCEVDAITLEWSEINKQEVTKWRKLL